MQQKKSFAVASKDLFFRGTSLFVFFNEVRIRMTTNKSHIVQKSFTYLKNQFYFNILAALTLTNIIFLSHITK